MKGTVNRLGLGIIVTLIIIFFAVILLLVFAFGMDKKIIDQIKIWIRIMEVS